MTSESARDWTMQGRVRSPVCCPRTRTDNKVVDEGSGNPVPAYDSNYRPGDNLYTNSAIAFDAANGKITWYFQYTPNDNHDYDEIGSHILIGAKVNGEDRKVVAHPARNSFSYMLDRLNGQFLKGVQTVKELTWTKGLDPKTGKPIDHG